jgi:uncharacterized damage-inducible protein DinB
MNADAFRHFYEYHFSENRKIWDSYVKPLAQEKFTQDVDYSHGSVRDQLVHMMSADETWFSALRGEGNTEPRDPARYYDKGALRADWDALEQKMRAYLATLRDEMLFTKPFPEHDEDKVLILWQVLLHVANHGTDHRAQVLRLLNDLGVKTGPQDYVFYVYEHVI